MRQDALLPLNLNEKLRMENRRCATTAYQQQCWAPKITGRHARLRGFCMYVYVYMIGYVYVYVYVLQEAGKVRAVNQMC